MQRRPTIIDVARAAGVSKSTVSLVLKESPVVAEDTRALVRQAMVDLGYVYNRSAANLRGSNAGLVGLVINDIRNPFFTEFAASAQMAMSARGYATVVANTDENPALQAEVVGSMIEHGISALILSPAYGAGDTFDKLARAGIPTIQVLRRIDERGDLFPFASHDYGHGSEAAARHLIATGARNIAFVGGLADRPITAERMSGYLAVMAEAGRTPVMIQGRASRAFGHEVAATLASRHGEVDAALCFNDLVALGMLSGFARAGRPVGEAFRLVGFDDIEECAQAFPALSSVRCDIPRFARETTAALLDWLEKGTRPPAETRMPVELVVRASSAG